MENHFTPLPSLEKHQQKDKMIPDIRTALNKKQLTFGATGTPNIQIVFLMENFHGGKPSNHLRRNTNTPHGQHANQHFDLRFVN